MINVPEALLALWIFRSALAYPKAESKRDDDLASRLRAKEAELAAALRKISETQSACEECKKQLEVKQHELDKLQAESGGKEPVACTTVLHLPLDKIRTGQVLDVSGQSYPVLGDPAVEPDETLGSVLALDGADDFVDCGNQEKLSITGDLTLEAWVCPEGDLHGITLLSKHFDGEYDLTFWKQRLAYYHGPDWHRNYHFFDPTFEPGQWRHVAVVRRADAKRVSFYLDGEKSGDDHAYEDPPPATDNRFGVGYRLNTGTNAFQGRMADVRVYDRALDPKEIRQDMENPRP